MKIDEIYELKRLAGIVDKSGNTIQSETGTPNISNTGTKKSQYQTKHKVKPGTDEWFKLWFAQPHLTGERPMPKDEK